jgi:predicted nuclease of predicted toxin-antitoxin system
MRFLVDAQLPPTLARWLAQEGHEAEHVFDRLPPGTTDTTIWNEAVRLDAVIVTKDEDFQLRSLHVGHGPKIVWLRVGNTSNRALMEWVVPLWPRIVEALNRGERLVEVV